LYIIKEKEVQKMKIKWEKPGLIDLDTMVAYGKAVDMICAPEGMGAAGGYPPFICIPNGSDIKPPMP